MYQSCFSHTSQIFVCPYWPSQKCWWLRSSIISWVLKSTVSPVSCWIRNPKKKGGKLSARVAGKRTCSFFFWKKSSSLRKAMEANQMCISHLFRRFCPDWWITKWIQKLQIYAMPRFGWFTGCQMLGLMALHFDVPHPVCSWGTKGSDIIFDLFSQGANAA